MAELYGWRRSFRQTRKILIRELERRQVPRSGHPTERLPCRLSRSDCAARFDLGAARVPAGAAASATGVGYARLEGLILRILAEGWRFRVALRHTSMRSFGRLQLWIRNGRATKTRTSKKHARGTSLRTPPPRQTGRAGLQATLCSLPGRSARAQPPNASMLWPIGRQLDARSRGWPDKSGRLNS